MGRAGNQGICIRIEKIPKSGADQVKLTLSIPKALAFIEQLHRSQTLELEASIQFASLYLVTFPSRIFA